VPTSSTDSSVPAAARELLALLQEAGDAALRHFSPEVRVERKADGSPVTAADRAAEAVLLAGIARLYPEDSAESEEGGRLAGRDLAQAAARWVIDPLDGTSAFTEGLAHWGPSLARLDSRGGGPFVRAGATWLPRLGEYWWVEGEHRLHAVVRDGTAAWRRLDGALVPRRVLYIPSEMHTWSRPLPWQGKARCLGGTAAHLALVARGSAGAAVVGPGWSSWDVAAGLGLIVGCGGVVQTIGSDQPMELGFAGGVVLPPASTPFVAGHPDVVAELVAALASIAGRERFNAGEVDAT
jgi:3'(2'), 5'-bisphosphate nucleotidase